MANLTKFEREQVKAALTEKEVFTKINGILAEAGLQDFQLKSMQLAKGALNCGENSHAEFVCTIGAGCKQICVPD